MRALRPDPMFHAVWKCLNHVKQPCRGGGIAHGKSIGMYVGYTDIRFDRAVHKVNVLTRRSQSLKPIFAEYFAKRRSIDQYLSIIGLIQAQQQVYDGGLACAAGSNQ